MKKSVKMLCAACVVGMGAFVTNPALFSKVQPSAIEKVSFVNKDAPAENRAHIPVDKVKADMKAYILSKHSNLDKDLKVFLFYYLDDLYYSHGIYMLGVSVKEPISNHNLPKLFVLYRDGHIYELTDPENGDMQTLAVLDKSVFYYSYVQGTTVMRPVIGRILIDGKKYIKQEIEYKDTNSPAIVLKRDRATNGITVAQKEAGKLTVLGMVQDDYFDEFVILQGAEKTRNTNFIKH